MKVIGVGDNVVDKYTHIRTMYPGGNALNFSVYAKRLGADSAYLGIFGSDEAAQHIQDVLSEMDIETSHCRIMQGENGFALVGLENGDRVFLGSNEGGIRKHYKLEFDAKDLSYIKQFDLLHTSKYSYMEGELEKLKAAGIPVSFDFSDDFTEEYLEQVGPYVDYSILSCSHLGENETKMLARKMVELGSTIVIATRGSAGAIIFDGNSFFYQKPHLVEAVDTLGAGDSFLTAFLLEYIEKSKEGAKDILLKAALEKAAEFAAKTCLVEGAFGFGKSY